MHDNPSFKCFTAQTLLMAVSTVGVSAKGILHNKCNKSMDIFATDATHKTKYIELTCKNYAKPLKTTTHPLEIKQINFGRYFYASTGQRGKEVAKRIKLDSDFRHK